MKLRQLLHPGLLALIGSASLQVTASEDFSSLFIFGDSFTDSGNVYIATGSLIPPDPPYYQGRFSNGPVWVEYLADGMGLQVEPNGVDPTIVQGNNFAVGGARNGTDIPVGLFGTLPSVHSQVSYFVEASGTVPADALYILFGGHNDVRYAADPAEELSIAEQNAVIEEAVDALASSVTRLANAGAESFLIPNLADLGITPEARIDRQNAQRASALTTLFNTLLAAALDERETALGVNISRVDVFSFANEVVEDAALGGSRYGITNVEVPILPGASGSPGAPAETSLFFDNLHVSAVAHAILGDIAAEIAGVELAGGQRPGDCNQDGDVDLSDAVCLFGFLYTGDPVELPCGLPGPPEPDGFPGTADLALLDWEGDGALDLTDGVALLGFFYTGGPDHALAPSGSCVRVRGCPESCAP